MGCVCSACYRFGAGIVILGRVYTGVEGAEFLFRNDLVQGIDLQAHGIVRIAEMVFVEHAHVDTRDFLDGSREFKVVRTVELCDEVGRELPEFRVCIFPQIGSACSGVYRVCQDGTGVYIVHGRTGRDGVS